ncbi:hypothetical protein K8I28_02495 [bacterium]|nr:hypothetical protein [bacterium]
MEAWLEFGRGPLFRFCLVILILGLLRSVVLSLYGMNEALRRAGDKIVPWSDLTNKTFQWLIPVTRLFRKRPVYSAISFIWHIGVILVPLFLSAHVLLLFANGIGIHWWPEFPQRIADLMTLITVIMGILLFLGRVSSRESRFLSRFQDYAWVPLITLTFLTGGLCANLNLSAGSYQFSMLLHVYSADLILMLIPFTKVAHCVLLPMSQYISGVAWKFPKNAGDRVAETIGKEGMPV